MLFLDDNKISKTIAIFTPKIPIILKTTVPLVHTYFWKRLSIITKVLVLQILSERKTGYYYFKSVQKNSMKISKKNKIQIYWKRLIHY